jgi:transcriptional regulator with XRE-family HTH domain
MSPSAYQLKTLRTGRGLRQSELAEMVGYEQSYLSALELGLKGPPTQEFVDQFISALKLSEEEQDVLHEAVAASQRKVVVPHEAPPEVYWLCYKLSQQIDHLHPVQIKLIETALNLPVNFSLPTTNSAPPRIMRRDRKTTKSEATM